MLLGSWSSKIAASTCFPKTRLVPLSHMINGVTIRRITIPTTPMHSKAEMASFVGQLVQKVRKAAFFLEDIRPAPVNTISSNAPASWNLGLRIIEPDMEKMTRNIVDMLVGTIVQPTHPLLAKIASYYFELKVCVVQIVVVVT
jgi:hypothetical protein